MFREIKHEFEGYLDHAGGDLAERVQLIQVAPRDCLDRFSLELHHLLCNTGHSRHRIGRNADALNDGLPFGLERIARRQAELNHDGVVFHSSLDAELENAPKPFHGSPEPVPEEAIDNSAQEERRICRLDDRRCSDFLDARA